jgi:carbon-monoxide dehydrogenase small subunit
MLISVSVNGRVYERDIKEHLTLLRFLREELELTGTKEGCAAGECGACTVFLNGMTVNSCLVLAAEADGATIETIEGEAADGELSPVQTAFDRQHAVQCGFCTGGMIMSIKELLTTNPTPSVEEIKEGIEGNFCRCTGYQQIIEAVLDASGQLTAETKGELQHVS